MSSFNTVSVVGSFFGDEGKAKIVDALSSDFDYVVRYQGGDNAGHTIYIDSRKYIFQLIPCGIIQSKAVITHGVVLNPEHLLQEISQLESHFPVKGKLFVSRHAHIIGGWNIAFDKLLEHMRKNPIGTTGRGIGPTYAFKALRLGIRAVDLLDRNSLREKLEIIFSFCNPLFKFFSFPEFDLEKETTKYYDLGQKIKDYLIDTREFLEREIRNNKKVLFEGSQGIMLDLDLGTYPFVTSSNIIGALSSGTGLSFDKFKKILGAVKAYSSRVGNGEFVTEIHEEKISDYIRTTGNEFGSVTGRKRRIGWLDLVALKYVVEISGISEIALTLVDVLNNMDEVKVCVEYSKERKPIYKSFKGWRDSYDSIKSYEDFSSEFRDYVSFIEEFLSVRVSIISFGKSREQILIRP